MVLRQVQHPNIVRLHCVYKAYNDKDVYLLFEFMEADLYQVSRSDILEESHRRFIIYQLLRAVKYLHSGGLIHRDLKPSNVLLNQKCEIKLCDFGLVRTKKEQIEGLVMTQHVATRWYRAPQILFGSTRYGQAVDIWSLGCVIAEMYRKGKPLFSGSSTLHQIEKVLQYTGLPSQEDLAGLQSVNSDKVLQPLRQVKQKPQNYFFSEVPPDVLQIIKSMLVFNPRKRPTADQLLKFKYIKCYRSAQPTIQKAIQLQIQDSIRLSVKEYRRLIYSVAKKEKEEAGESIRKSMTKRPSNSRNFFFDSYLFQSKREAKDSLTKVLGRNRQRRADEDQKNKMIIRKKKQKISSRALAPCNDRVIIKHDSSCSPSLVKEPLSRPDKALLSSYIEGRNRKSLERLRTNNNLI